VSGEAVGSADRVCQLEVPPDVLALSTLTRIGYADTFLVDIGRSDRTAEECAREILEGAPPVVRAQLYSGWSMLGLKIGVAASDRSVLGWQVRRRAPDHVLLGAHSRLGMPGELLFKRDGTRLLFATFVQHGNVAARGIWATVEPAHVRMVRRLLDHGGRRLSR